MEEGQESPTISFQVILNPIYNQKGDEAVLMEQIRILAEDIWTQRFLEQEIDDLETPQEVR